MIINDQQLAQLIQIANLFMVEQITKENPNSQNVAILLDEINHQQSTELKETLK